MPQIELYQSSNGDCWFLCKNETGNVYIVHEPNRASGGKASTVEVATFLSQQHGPQHRALINLIGSLVDQSQQAGQQGEQGGQKKQEAFRPTDTD